MSEVKGLRNHLEQYYKLSSELVNSYEKKTTSYAQFQAEYSRTDYSAETEIEIDNEKDMNLLLYHYDNNLLAQVDNFLNLESDESDPDWMTVEYFTKLQNQELRQAEIERDELYNTFLRGL